MEPRIVRFNSLGDFVQYLQASNPRSKNPSSMGYGNRGWYGTASMQEAYDLARDGWESEAEQVAALSKPLIEKMTSIIERPEMVMDVVGNSLDVPEYLAGNPECWMRYESHTVEGHGTKHMRIVFNAMISGGISTEVIRAKGAAITALVEALEWGGCRVQVDVAIGYRMFESYVTVKHADQHLDVPRLVFALAHPSMARRFFFGLLERQPEHRALGCGSGYGGNGAEYTWRHPCSEKGDLYFGHSYYGEPHWLNADSVQEWVIEKLKEQGVSVREEN